MARASSVVSARAMAPGSLTQQRNRTKLADSCSATVAGFYAAVDNLRTDGIAGVMREMMTPRQLETAE